MKKRLLITGGAGFIGSTLCEKLKNKNYSITVLDNFNAQIHSGNSAKTDSGDVNVISGDVRDKHLFFNLLAQQDYVIHLAAETGTGQSMYNIAHYSDVNISATSLLCEFLVNGKHTIQKVLVASSRAIYGEGKYNCSNCGVVYPAERTFQSLDKTNYNPACPSCGGTATMQSLPTDENAKIHPASIYGLTKQVQEQMILLTCKMIGVPAFALRYQNVYGPGQSLINPYTGILAIFAKQAYFNQPIHVFEDGNESRDFVFVQDVADATVQCLESNVIGQYSFNVGSGKSVTVMEVANTIVQHFSSNSTVGVNGAFREGDIRHNVADITAIHAVTGYQPKWEFAAGIAAFLQWAAVQPEMAEPSKYAQSIKELELRGLYRK